MPADSKPSPLMTIKHQREMRLLFALQLTGILSMCLWFGIVSILSAYEPHPYIGSWRLMVGQLVAGRAYSVSAGLRDAFPKLFLLIQCSLQDIVILLVLYPLFGAGFGKASQMRIIGPVLIRIHSSAERHKTAIGKLGIMGLMVFVFFPFWSTGALAGGVAAYLLGMRMRLALPAIIIGNTGAVACWIWLYDRLRALNESVADFVPWIILFVVCIAAIFAFIQRYTRRK